MSWCACSLPLALVPEMSLPGFPTPGVMPRSHDSSHPFDFRSLVSCPCSLLSFLFPCSRFFLLSPLFLATPRRVSRQPSECWIEPLLLLAVIFCGVSERSGCCGCFFFSVWLAASWLSETACGCCLLWLLCFPFFFSRAASGLSSDLVSLFFLALW